MGINWSIVDPIKSQVVLIPLKRVINKIKAVKGRQTIKAKTIIIGASIGRTKAIKPKMICRKSFTIAGINKNNNIIRGILLLLFVSEIFISSSAVFFSCSSGIISSFPPSAEIVLIFLSLFAIYYFILL